MCRFSKGFLHGRTCSGHREHLAGDPSQRSRASFRNRSRTLTTFPPRCRDAPMRVGHRPNPQMRSSTLFQPEPAIPRRGAPHNSTPNNREAKCNGAAKECRITEMAAGNIRSRTVPQCHRTGSSRGEGCNPCKARTLQYLLSIEAVIATNRVAAPVGSASSCQRGTLVATLEMDGVRLKSL